ncbi:MAG: hypothetical protein D6800_04615 [Candidatus Zixiibacteriota bacterium]|nr:MAG: hypothetical protein D6800_04615 [candidate division Zixibacteria bacterium]
MLASQLGMATVREVNQNTIRLGFYAAGSASLQVVKKDGNLKAILEELRNHFGGYVQLEMFLDKNSAPPPVTTESRMRRVDPKELLEKSPRLRRLVEKVNGEIIGIKDMNDNKQTKKG